MKSISTVLCSVAVLVCPALASARDATILVTFAFSVNEPALIRDLTSTQPEVARNIAEKLGKHTNGLSYWRFSSGTDDSLCKRQDIPLVAVNGFLVSTNEGLRYRLVLSHRKGDLTPALKDVDPPRVTDSDYNPNSGHSGTIKRDEDEDRRFFVAQAKEAFDKLLIEANRVQIEGFLRQYAPLTCEGIELKDDPQHAVLGIQWDSAFQGEEFRCECQTTQGNIPDRVDLHSYVVVKEYKAPGSTLSGLLVKHSEYFHPPHIKAEMKPGELKDLQVQAVFFWREPAQNVGLSPPSYAK